MSDWAAVDGLADRLFGAIGAGDIDTLRDCMSVDMTVWTNFDGRTVDRDAALATIGWLVVHVNGLHYEVVERLETSGGFVQRHILRGTSRSGVDIAMPACIVATVADGRVTSMAEYLDPSPLVAAVTS